MIDLKKIDGPLGIPIYHQRMPDMVKSVAMSWIVFSGSADDTRIGSPGLHHWFEHVPFRGTKKYPGGYSDIQGPFTKWGGEINAWTNYLATSFWANVHTRVWRDALSVITDLMSEPLLTDEGIDAEREIIGQEIRGSLASISGRIQQELPGILWSGHPLGHGILGNYESLESMSHQVLRRAHRESYDKSRCALLFVGNVSEADVVEELERISEIIPNNGLSERRKTVDYSPFPMWQNGQVTIRETEHKSSIVRMLFPVSNEIDTVRRYARWAAIENLFDFGQLSSPLLKTVREERRLVYNTSAGSLLLPNGGYFKLTAMTERAKVDAVVEAFRDVIRSKEVKSSGRLQEIQEGKRCAVDMQSISPGSFLSIASQRYLDCGSMVSDRDYLNLLSTITLEEIEGWIQDLSRGNEHVVIFKGMG